VFNDQEQQSTGATQVEATDQMVGATQQEVKEHQEEAPMRRGCRPTRVRRTVVASSHRSTTG
jgi:hypothetical protein